MTTPEADIVTLLRQGLSNSAIVRELRCDKNRVRRLRTHHGIPAVLLQPLTLEEKWKTKTRQVEDGHVEWTGSRGSAGTPVLAYRAKLHTAASIAFRIRTGRDPVGYVLPECGREHCVAQEHVEDEPGRQKAREQLRYLTGGTARPGRCVHGHDQAVHGKYESDGRAYCGLCKAEQRAAHRAQEAAGGAAPRE
ncbi:hypothetical protein [Streptomyces sp. AM 2-1-1]|uniref:hypothetical protein n=1 Tax=Streptomyces sp. AM 2-1-1 TaxID=3028709 RepID=UPI0023B9E84B|nr:hypothetical protein [Streptomyces sp. AM 2-1-1]WEH40770.1 hypothetical protein PZB77_15360 [Streptomyces sp. AM 2-1-1]